MYFKKRVLVAGGTGTIGVMLVRHLIQSGANVSVVSMHSAEYAKKILPKGIAFKRRDLTQLKNCLDVTKNADYVFNLVGLKGSVGIGQSKVASFLVPMLYFQTSLMEAAFRNRVSRFLFVGSINEYPASKKPKKEDSVWEGSPVQNDRIPGLAKRIGEIQAEAYKLEHGWDAVRIVRLTNVYGPFDDFNPKTAQVIPALISRIASGENPLKIWGNGEAVRDFMYSEDAAFWIMKALEKAPGVTPINLSGGEAVSIKKLAGLISECMPHSPRIQFDASKPSGDPVRLLSLDRAKKLLRYRNRTPLKVGLQKTVDWYLQNRKFYEKKIA